MKQSININTKFRLHDSHLYLEYFDPAKNQWLKYTTQDFGYIILVNDWNLISSDGFYIKEEENPVWTKIGDENLISQEDLSEGPVGDNVAYFIYAQNLAKIQALPLKEMMRRSFIERDLPGFVYAWLMYLLKKATLDHVDDLREFYGPSKIWCDLKERMDSSELKTAIEELILSLAGIAAAAEIPLKEIFQNPLYKAELVEYYPFLEDLHFPGDWGPEGRYSTYIGRSRLELKELPKTIGFQKNYLRKGWYHDNACRAFGCLRNKTIPILIFKALYTLDE